MKTIKTVMIFICTIQTCIVFMTTPSHCVNIGDPFPLFMQPHSLSQDECAYLGIPCSEDFALGDLAQDVIILEFLNVYCHTCRIQVEIFNDLYGSIQEDPQLAGKVCIVGIAVGNTVEEVGDFKREFGARYPIVTDPEKVLFKMTGNIQGTPHTYILRKEEKRFIIDYHAGGVSSHDRYLKTITFAMRGSFAGTEPGNKASGYSFVSEGKRYDQTMFKGKRVILYFPVDKNYPLAIDTRNSKNQIELLYKILARFPDMSAIVYAYHGFSIPAKPTPASLYIGRPSDKQPLDNFTTPDSPTIYYINEYGRIAYKGEAITLYNAEAIIEGKEYKPTLDMTEKEIIALIEKKISTFAKEVLSTEKFVMENRQAVYVSTLAPKRDGLFWFSRLESKPSLCDICHDTHFIYIMDHDGRIIDFIPLQLTKYGNVTWTEDDTRTFKDTVVGKNIFDTFSFNPKVDALTQATMSSSLVFEGFNQAKDVFAEFKEYKFRSTHWKQTCFETMCTIQHVIGQSKQADPALVADNAVLKDIITRHKLPACPLQGMYIMVDGSILCSIHGINMQGCK